jgi:starvation-inducible DNA-binding protein
MSTTERTANSRAGTERKKTVKTLIPMRNGMSDEQRKGVVALLNLQVADHYVLLTKTKFYHWNVEGPEFHDLHELLDEQYEILAEMVDELAEQNLKLGGQAAGTLAWFKAHTRLGEDEGDSIPDTRRMIEHLKDDRRQVQRRRHLEPLAGHQRQAPQDGVDVAHDLAAEHTGIGLNRPAFSRAAKREAVRSRTGTR